VNALPIRLPKTHLVYWQHRVFRPVYNRSDGTRVQCANYAVELSFRKKRVKWSLDTPNQEAAAARAKEMYIFLHATGWAATFAKYKSPAQTAAHDVRRNKRLELLRDELELRPLSNGKLSKRFWEIVRGIGCTSCGFYTWPSILQFHHIDADRTNDSLWNLTILCPNCHRALHQKVATIPCQSLGDLLGITSECLPRETPIRKALSKKPVQVKEQFATAHAVDLQASTPLSPEEERFLTLATLQERWQKYGYSKEAISRAAPTLGLESYRFLRAVRYRLSDILRVEAAGILPRKEMDSSLTT
jgi:hypothetical protein